MTQPRHRPRRRHSSHDADRILPAIDAVGRGSGPALFLLLSEFDACALANRAGRAIRNRQPIRSRRAGPAHRQAALSHIRELAMAEIIESPTGKEALAFDDVLLAPGYSTILPADADIGTRLTRSISLNLPIISAAMDTVTEARLAIAMAQAGGIEVIHR